MTLEALYQAIDGDYNQALKVLRVEKLLDKHIKKLPQNKIFASLRTAGESMDAEQLFESAHAMKGVCANLGLVKLSNAASDIAEEFRPGNSRSMTDEQVKAIVRDIDAMYQKAVSGIQTYTKEQS